MNRPKEPEAGGFMRANFTRQTAPPSEPVRAAPPRDEGMGLAFRREAKPSAATAGAQEEAKGPPRFTRGNAPRKETAPATEAKAESGAFGGFRSSNAGARGGMGAGAGASRGAAGLTRSGTRGGAQGAGGDRRPAGGDGGGFGGFRANRGRK